MQQQQNVKRQKIESSSSPSTAKTISSSGTFGRVLNEKYDHLSDFVESQKRCFRSAQPFPHSSFENVSASGGKTFMLSIYV